MDVREQPLVSVVTPVYNGEAYMEECIESVLAQTYLNWEYIIVNNASTDGTLRIAEAYAARDHRIRIHSNRELLPIIANHNKAFSLISTESKYCKVVSADDWLSPDCLSRMVSLAVANPTVGLVGSYQLRGAGSDWRGWDVRWAGLPYSRVVIPGRELCRLYMLDGFYVFGTPTSTIYRADLVRSQKDFYPNSSAEADTSACIKSLGVSDFGFVHQVLSYERVHPGQITTTSKSVNAYLASKISDLQEYGSLFLTPDEIDQRLKFLIDEYYSFLAGCTVKFKGRKFWDYQKQRLAELGHPLDRVRLGKAVCTRSLSLFFDPRRAANKLLGREAHLQERHQQVGN